MKQNSAERKRFEAYLQTGRWIANEVKFNPYHDPQDGRFTFGPGGHTRDPLDYLPR